MFAAAQVVIEELDPQPPEEVAKAAGQKRKADLAAMEPKSAKRPAAQVQEMGLVGVRVRVRVRAAHIQAAHAMCACLPVSVLHTCSP